MRIIRFIDENDLICYGQTYADNKSVLLEGNLYSGFRTTDKKVKVKKLLAPVEPVAILCIGLNYHQHAQETGAKLPRYPVLFMKNPAALNHPEDPIIIPPLCMDPPEVDLEVELAVIIAKAAKDVPKDKALEYVLGYTIANDVSARRWQKKSGGGQWVLGKSFDTFCPLGPCLVTADEISNPQTLQIKSILNGNVMQDTNTSDMIFSVAEIIEFLSSCMTLLPGTVILTGTPSGVGFVRKPPVFLQPGDMIELTIDQIGTLSNPVA
jgi:2-keto-4-pentenoate hydratase/2-oxohepta-3-ene-1,7-dioic acid hydratase in catechol pathway